tara:strand:+ start:2442 stop:2708 length:267 start_codon:yes stop_codon:yes gene_type:complete
MAVNNEEVMGDVIEIPSEFLVLRDKYILELNESLISYGVLRKHGSSDFINDLDKHIKDIAHAKSWVAEINDQIETIKQQQPKGKTDDS